MNEFWQDMIIDNAIGVILSTVKNPNSLKKWKAALLKVRNKINAAFIGDPDFQ